MCLFFLVLIVGGISVNNNNILESIFLICQPAPKKIETTPLEIWSKRKAVTIYLKVVFFIDFYCFSFAI